MKSKIVLGALLLLGTAFSCMVAYADPPVISGSPSFTGSGVIGVPIQLQGVSACSLTNTGGSGSTVKIQTSNDGTNWQDLLTETTGNTGTAGVGSSNTGLVWFRINVTIYGSGTGIAAYACNGSVQGGSGGGGTSTFPPYPWIVQPTNVPTLNVNCVSGGCPTPIPFPSPYFNFSPAPNGAAILGVVPVSPSGTPWPLNAGNQPIVQVSALPAAGPTSSPGNVPLVTDVQANASPQPTAASGIRKTVTCDPTTGTQCATVTSGGALVTTGFQNSSGVVVATICDKFASVAISSQTTTELVAASGSTAVYLCGAVVGYNGTTTTATLNFKYGTKTTNPCDTGAVSITGAIGIGTGTAATLPVSVMPFNTMAYYATPASQELCATTVGTNSITVLVSYAQH